MQGIALGMSQYFVDEIKQDAKKSKQEIILGNSKHK